MSETRCMDDYMIDFEPHQIEQLKALNNALRDVQSWVKTESAFMRELANRTLPSFSNAQAEIYAAATLTCWGNAKHAQEFNCLVARELPIYRPDPAGVAAELDWLCEEHHHDKKLGSHCGLFTKLDYPRSDRLEIKQIWISVTINLGRQIDLPRDHAVQPAMVGILGTLESETAQAASALRQELAARAAIAGHSNYPVHQHLDIEFALHKYSPYSNVDAENVVFNLSVNVSDLRRDISCNPVNDNSYPVESHLNHSNAFFGLSNHPFEHQRHGALFERYWQAVLCNYQMDLHRAPYIRHLWSNLRSSYHHCIAL